MPTNSAPLSSGGSELPPNAPDSLAPRPRRVRWWHTLTGRTVLGLLAVLVLGGGVWYNGHRRIGWGETVNPFYWLRRWRGEDLYSVSQAYLQHGTRALPEVALTFDDGPHPESRASILDTLRRYQAHATFFDVGVNMEAHPELVRRTLAEGSEIANHSMYHNRLPALSARDRHREINDADIAYFAITGQHLTLLRPPGMNLSDDAQRDIRALGYTTIGYNTASRDFDPTETVRFIADRTLNRTENGSILLLHDYPTTAAALPQILAGLTAQGYRCVTISEMLAHLPPRERTPALKFLTGGH